MVGFPDYASLWWVESWCTAILEKEDNADYMLWKRPGEPEQSDARRVAESWFLKWRIARGDRVIRNVRCTMLSLILPLSLTALLCLGDETLITRSPTALKFPASHLSKDWDVSPFLVVDDFENLTPLTADKKEIAQSLADIYRKVGIRGVANWKAAKRSKQRDSIDIVVVVFDDVDACRRQWNAKYEYDGFDEVFSKHVEKDHVYLDCRDCNRRLTRVRNAWIETSQESEGKAHIRIGLELLLQCTQKSKDGTKPSDVTVGESD